MVKKIYFICIIWICLLNSCKSPIEKNKTEFPSLSEYVNNTPADSIIVGKSFEFKASNEFTFSNQPGQKVVQFTSPVLASNTYKSNDTISHPPISSDTIRNVTPEIKEAIPYVSNVTHPKPVKSGELRSTNTSNEHIQYLDIEQGLPTSNIHDIKEDSKGFLWIAHNKGLTMYDGYNFYTYTTQNGLITNSINEIIIDKNDNIYLSTSKGLVIYNGTNFFTYTDKNGLLGSEIGHILQDDNGDFWLATSGSICRFDGKKFYHYTAKHGIPNTSYYNIGLDSLNRVYVLNYHSQFCLIDKNKILTFERDSKYFGSVIASCAFRDSNKHLWFGHYNGGIVETTPFGNSKKYFPKTGFGYSAIASIIEDEEKNMWFATNEGGMVCFDGINYKIFTIKEGLTSNNINALFKDRNNNIWVATSGGGLNKITPNSFKTYTSREGFSDKIATCMIKNKKGEMVFGTFPNGLWTFDNKRFRQLKPLKSNIIRDLAIDKKGDLIVAVHQDKIFRLTLSKNDTVSYDSIYPYGTTTPLTTFGNYNIVFDSKENLWAGDELFGVNKYELNKEKNAFDKVYHFDSKAHLSSENITILFADSKDNIWVAYRQLGLSKISEQHISHYTTKNGLSSNQVNCFFENKNNDIWIGTSNGLTIFNQTLTQTITIADGLSSNSILSIVKDGSNRIWVSTNRGLNLLSPDSSKKSGYSISNFFHQDGLKGIEFMPNCSYYDSSLNNLWWSLPQGLVSLNLNNFDKKYHSPRVFLNQINLMGSYINYRGILDSVAKGKKYFINDNNIELSSIKFDSLVPFFNYPKKLILPYYLNGITFSFASLNGNPSNRIQYHYILKGNDANWNIETNLPEAKYSNLKAGNYNFIAQAKIDGLDWGPSCNYEFTVLPPFWETWWFRIVVIAAIVVIVIRIFKWRNKTLIQRQAQLEETVVERTQEIHQQKHLIEEKQKEIIDSINYAKRIQNTLLAHKDFLDEHIPHHFICFNPKDIVSGDFYWAAKHNNKFYLAVCDSTGHGVPGAFMSLLNIGFLNEAINEKNIEFPDKIFNYVRNRLVANMSKEGQKDGFDGIIICIEENSREIKYAAANNAPLIISNGQIIPQKHDRMPVGFGEKKEDFNLYSVTLNKGDILYLFTDGFADQFGGPKGKKFKTKHLHEALLSVSALHLNLQVAQLEKTFQDWKQDLEQVDDVCVIGLKIS